jgi:hypothetical protein
LSTSGDEGAVDPPVRASGPGVAEGHTGEGGVDFAPADLTDGRQPYDWESRYKGWRCWLQISAECAYLALLMLAAPVVLVLVWLGEPGDWLGIGNDDFHSIATYLFAWTGGLLGGTLFAMKWLYHSVAHGQWNVDRWLWRFFTPHLSGAFSFGIIALVTSGLFDVLDRDTLKAPSAVVGMSLLFGYFSDYTVARLASFAKRVLGVNESQ